MNFKPFANQIYHYNWPQSNTDEQIQEVLRNSHLLGGQLNIESLEAQEVNYQESECPPQESPACGCSEATIAWEYFDLTNTWTGTKRGEIVGWIKYCDTDDYGLNHPGFWAFNQNVMSVCIGRESLQQVVDKLKQLDSELEHDA